MKDIRLLASDYAQLGFISVFHVLRHTSTSRLKISFPNLPQYKFIPQFLCLKIYFRIGIVVHLKPEGRGHGAVELSESGIVLMLLQTYRMLL